MPNSVSKGFGPARRMGSLSLVKTFQTIPGKNRNSQLESEDEFNGFKHHPAGTKICLSNLGTVEICEGKAVSGIVIHIFLVGTKFAFGIVCGSLGCTLSSNYI